ncbi:hypothetical protein SAMN04488535_1318 [Corynebacterium mycetoides]|uniref:Uncharacterized protein n=1 Tax=Corynebacterium mycetoides TaxID=38302 RepID=A0A1G9P6T8_9CORY|nr:hypothetical protein [Corynebacterium mycetoides]SDL93947.1 hypothetical protein SAMN04488535_1318 [Corynebacterium mycetoides]
MSADSNFSSGWAELSSKDAIGGTLSAIAKSFGEFFKAVGDLAGLAAKYL